MTTLDQTVIRDQNRTPIWWGISSVDGVSLVAIKVDSVTGYPLIETGTSTSAVMSHIPENLPRDGNRVPAIGGVLNDGSGVIVPLSVNPATGAILVQTA